MHVHDLVETPGHVVSLDQETSSRVSLLLCYSIVCYSILSYFLLEAAQSEIEGP